MEVLGQRLKWLRKEERYSQKDLAEKIGMTASGYQKIENNEREPKLDVLVKLCNILNVTSDFLLGRNDRTEKIEKLKDILDNAQESLTISEVKLNQLRSKILKLQESMNVPSPFNGRGDSEQREQYNTYQKQIEYYNQAYYKNEMTFDNCLFDYIIELYKIPFSNPEEDNIIKEYLPLDLTLEEYEEKNYKIELKSLKGTFIGLVFMVQSENKEENYKKAKKTFEEHIDFFRIKS